MVWLASPERGNDAAREQAVRLRPTTSGDLPNVLAMEADPDASRFIVRWSRERHVQAIAAPDESHLTVLDGDAVVGFVLLAGLTNEHDSIELRRIVVHPPGRGIGRRAIRAVLEEAFIELGAHRVWLDVKLDNHRARRTYAACGFVVEGILREALLTGGSYESLIVMSVLAREWTSGGHNPNATD